MADKLTEGIAEKTEPVLREAGYELADLELVKEGANWYLRFFIEHIGSDAPVTIEDCRNASEKLSDWLDEIDPIPQAYFLEVSSPGIERPLKKERDFVRFQGHMVQVGTFLPVEGEKIHLGLLGPATADTLTVRQEGRDLTIDRKKISGVRLYWEE